jgi:hypothetical protein
MFHAGTRSWRGTCVAVNHGARTETRAGLSRAQQNPSLEAVHGPHADRASAFWQTGALPRGGDVLADSGSDCDGRRHRSGDLARSTAWRLAVTSTRYDHRVCLVCRNHRHVRPSHATDGAERAYHRRMLAAGRDRVRVRPRLPGGRSAVEQAAVGLRSFTRTSAPPGVSRWAWARSCSRVCAASPGRRIVEQTLGDRQSLDQTHRKALPYGCVPERPAARTPRRAGATRDADIYTPSAN